MTASRQFRVWLFLLTCAWLAAPARAQQSVDVQLVGGAVVARCTLRCGENEIPANLVIDPGAKASLLLATKAAELVELGERGVVKLSFGRVVLAEVKAYAKELQRLESLTAEHAVELGEIPAVGILGLDAFEGQRVQLDLAAKKLRFAPVSAGPWGEPGPAAEVLAFAAGGRHLVVRGIGTDAGAVAVQLTGERYESLVRIDAQERCGVGGETSTGAALGKWKLGAWSAFRPSAMAGMPPPHPELVLGTQMLERFRLTIDAAEGKLWLEPTREPADVTAEQRAFLAIQRNDAAELEEFVTSHGESWLRPEASRDLLGLLMQGRPLDAARVRRGIVLYSQGVPAAKRGAALIALADDLLTSNEPGRIEAAGVALDLAGQFAGSDLNGTAVHEINARRGLLALKARDYTRARKLLLSAAFGLPRDPRVNLALAKLYRETGQPVRAWSRFMEAFLAKPSPPEALRGLDDLCRDAAFRAQFDAAQVERMLEGRIADFSPVLERTEEYGVGLVELFADVNHPRTAAAELAFRGLQQYWEGTASVFIEHHLDSVLGNDASTEVARAYGLKGTPALVVNGRVVSRAGGKAEAAAGVFREYLEAIRGADRVAEPVALTVGARRNQGRIAVTLDIGSTRTIETRVHVYLVESRVFAVGGNGVPLHWNVVRARLTESGGAASSGRRLWEQSVNEADVAGAVEREWLARAPAQGRWRMKPTWVDWRACSLVAVAETAENHRVVATASSVLGETP